VGALGGGRVVENAATAARDTHVRLQSCSR
jgi:hypothetical protein